MSSVPMDLAGKSILVAGGDGPLTTRLVEHLVLKCGATTRVLVANVSSAVRLARMRVEIKRGDITRRQDFDAATHGCDIVFNLLCEDTGDDRGGEMSNALSTRMLMASSHGAGVQRLIHLSSAKVYGDLPSGEIDEMVTRRRSRDADGQIKVEAAAIQSGITLGVPVVVLQPTLIYGPFVTTWTIKPLMDMRLGRVILVNGGEGLCNAVYVDDVVAALILAARKENVGGESFLISGKSPIPWREFYARYERMLGISATATMSLAEAKAYASRKAAANGVVRETLNILRENPTIRQRIFSSRELVALRKFAARFFSPHKGRTLKQDAHAVGKLYNRDDKVATNRPIVPISGSMAEFLARTSIVRIEKARRLLNYQPAFDLDSGMHLTEQWARWAGLLEKQAG